MVVDQTSFIAFICKIINVVTKQEKTSDRIKTVMNAAEELRPGHTFAKKH